MICLTNIDNNCTVQFVNINTIRINSNTFTFTQNVITNSDSKPDATDSGSPSSGTRTKDVKSPYNIPWTSEPLLEENEEEESTDEEDIFESETNRSEISVVTLTG